MFQKTSNLSFQKYGEVYTDYTNKRNHYPDNYLLRIKNDTIEFLYKSEEDIYLKMISGIALIIVCDNPSTNTYEQFVVSQIIKINKGIYFNFITLTKQSEIELNSSSFMNSYFLKEPFIYNKIKPSIKINEILAYYYNIKSNTHLSYEEKHNYYELTFVDHGSLNVTTDHQEYVLNEYDLIMYIPNQAHIQYNKHPNNCSFLTIIFDMETSNELTKLQNKVIHVDRDTHNALLNFVKVSDYNSTYKYDALTNHLQKILINLLKNNHKSIPVATSPMQQKFENELLSEILLYINENIYTVLSVEDLCEYFNISRSSLQTLFKNNIGCAPKQYINDLKLSKSKLLIKESKYTISEISSILGFASIHYFSRKFKQQYNISPSEYSKTIYN